MSTNYSNKHLAARLSVLSILVASAMPVVAESLLIDAGETKEIHNDFVINNSENVAISEDGTMKLIVSSETIENKDRIKVAIAKEGTITNNGTISLIASDLDNKGEITGNGKLELNYVPVEGTTPAKGSTLTLGDESSIQLKTISVSDAKHSITASGNATITATNFYISKGAESELSIITENKGDKLTIDAIISNSADENNGKIIKSGDGELVLKGKNTYKTKTQVNRGILTIAGDGVVVSNTNLADNTTFNVEGTAAGVTGSANGTTIDINGGKLAGSINLTEGTGKSTLNLNGNVTGNVSTQGSADVTVSGIIGKDDDELSGLINLLGQADSKLTVESTGKTKDVTANGILVANIKGTTGNIAAASFQNTNISGTTGVINAKDTSTVNVLTGGKVASIETTIGDLTTSIEGKVTNGITSAGKLLADVKNGGDVGAIKAKDTSTVNVLTGGKVASIETAGDLSSTISGNVTGTISAANISDLKVLEGGNVTGTITSMDDLIANIAGTTQAINTNSATVTVSSVTTNTDITTAKDLDLIVKTGAEVGHITVGNAATAASHVHVDGIANNLTFTDGRGWLTGNGNFTGAVSLGDVNISIGDKTTAPGSIAKNNESRVMQMKSLKTTANTTYHVKGVTSTEGGHTDLISVDTTANVDGLKVVTYNPIKFKATKAADSRETSLSQKILESETLLVNGASLATGDNLATSSHNTTNKTAGKNGFALDAEQYVFLDVNLVYKKDDADGKENLYLVYTKKNTTEYPDGGKPGIIDPGHEGNGTPEDPGEIISPKDPTKPVDPTKPIGPGEEVDPGNPNKPGNGGGENEKLIDDLDGTPNETNTGHGIDKLANNDPLKEVILGLGDKDKTLKAYNNLSGEIHATAKSAAINNSRYVRDAINNRLTAKAKQTIDTEDYVWISGWGRELTIKNDGNAAKTKNKGSGFLMGMDSNITENSRIGIAAGYEHANVTVDDFRASSAKIDTAHVAIYGGYDHEWADLRGAIAYGDAIFNTNRSIWVPGLESTATSNYSNGLIQAFVEGSRDYKLNEQFTATPYLNLAYVYLKGGSFKESGSDAAVRSEGKDHQVGYATLGGLMTYDINAYNTTLYSRLAWQHAIGKMTPESDLSFTNSKSTHNIRGITMDRDTALVGLGLNTELMKDVKFSLGYQGEFGKSMKDHSINATLNIVF